MLFCLKIILSIVCLNFALPLWHDKLHEIICEHRPPPPRGWNGSNFSDTDTVTATVTVTDTDISAVSGEMAYLKVNCCRAESFCWRDGERDGELWRL